MKKMVFLALAMVSTLSVLAQDLDQINDMMGASKFREAKAAIDKYLQDPKKANDAQGWYYKGRIYNALSRDSSISQQELYTLKNDAFQAFQKNQALDQKDVYLKLETHLSYLDLYYGFYDLGAKEFNIKKYDAALDAFKKANDVKDYILSKKYSYDQANLYVLDTSLILNIAAAAINAKKEDEAVSYYKKLTDANVAGKDFRDVYEYLADYYSKKDDQASLKAILDKAKKLYPESELWTEIEIRSVAKSGDKQALFAKYEELVAQNPGNFTLSYNYAIEMYNSLYGKEAKSVDNMAEKNKLTDVIKKSIDNEKQGDIMATVLMANHQYNMSADLLNASNAIKSTKPDDVKKKKDLKALADKSMDECIIYADKAARFYEGLATRTGGQKANYKIVLGYLIDIYGLKNNKAKAAEYEKKNAAADKL